MSRQAIYKTPKRRPAKAGPGVPSESDAAIIEVAKENPTDGTRMVAALAARELGVPVNRKRVQRIMRTRDCDLKGPVSSRSAVGQRPIHSKIACVSSRPHVTKAMQAEVYPA